jgi:opacity protein-like surface antigen
MKTRNLLAVAAALALSAALAATAVTTILSAATATGAGAAFDNPQARKTYQVSGATGSGTGTSVIAIEGSNNATNWDTVVTTTLALTTVTSSVGMSSDDRYAYTRANVTSISGTTATLTVTRSY